MLDINLKEAKREHFELLVNKIHRFLVEIFSLKCVE